MKVFEAIQLLLKAEGKATRSAIKQVSPELSHRHIAETLAANIDWLIRNKAGAITGLRRVSCSKAIDNGLKVYRASEVSDYGRHLFNSLIFKGADDLAEKHKKHAIGGFIGDVHHYSGVEDSPELRAALHARGYEEWRDEMGVAKTHWTEAGT